MSKWRFVQFHIVILAGSFDTRVKNKAHWFMILSLASVFYQLDTCNQSSTLPWIIDFNNRKKYKAQIIATIVQ